MVSLTKKRHLLKPLYGAKRLLGKQATVGPTKIRVYGSDHGAMKLGRGFYSGFHGLPKDPIRALYWLQKVVDGCKFKCLSGESMADAAEMLQMLDEQANELEE